MIDKTKTGLIGAITLLLVFGGVLYFSPEQLDNAYICDLTEEIGIFYGGISKTGLTAYPYEENRTNYVRCKKDGVKGVWIPLKEYAKENEINESDLIKNDTINNTIINNEIIPIVSNDSKIVTIEYPNGKTYRCFFVNDYSETSIVSETSCVVI